MVLVLPAAAGVLSAPALRRAALAALALAVDLIAWGGELDTRLGGDAPAWSVVALSIAVYAALAAKRPLPGYAAVWLLSWVGLLVPSYHPTAGMLLALYRISRRSSPTESGLALVGCLVPIAIATYNGATLHGDLDVGFALITGSLWTALFVAVWLVARAMLRADLRVNEERERAERDQADALRAERLRLSRELHDILAHSMTAIILQAAGALSGRRAGTVGDAQVDDVLLDVQQTGAQGMRELHRLLGLLRDADGLPPPDDPQAADGTSLDELSAELQAACRAAGFAISLAETGAPAPIDTSVRRTAYRVIQEGLANAMKHAPRGSTIRLEKTWQPGWLTLEIINGVRDVGAETPLASGGFGLLGLRERLQMVGGSMQTHRRDESFVLTVRLPTSEAARPAPLSRWDG